MKAVAMQPQRIAAVDGYRSRVVVYSDDGTVFVIAGAGSTKAQANEQCRRGVEKIVTAAESLRDE